MADDLDAQLDALEDAAPLTEEINDDVGAKETDDGKDEKVVKEAEAEEGAVEEWKPPTKEVYENVQKALRAEREEKRRFAQQLRLQEQNVAQIEQRVQNWQHQLLAQQLQQAPPDPYENPEGARQWQAERQRQLQALHQAEQQRQHQIAQQTQQARQVEALYQDVDEIEAEFTAQNPDYHEATDYLLKAQQTLLEQAGFPPEVANAQVASWSQSVAMQALRAGRNPAEWAYAQAKALGYRGKGQVSDAQMSAADKLAQIKAGQGSSKTLSGGGAGAKGGAGSLKAIVGLEGAAFDSAMDKFLNDAIRGR